MQPSQLYYVADPMCSWCWGFAPAVRAIETELSDSFTLRYVMGGLARDSDEPISDDVRAYVQNAWREVAARTGAEFNWDFWTRCQPRRSTYPACRAVLAAALQKTGPAMFHAIQRAYYLEARNPSDSETLTALAGELSLNTERFIADLASPEIEALLQQDFELRRRLQANAFPSLLLEKNVDSTWITRGWDAPEAVVDRLRSALRAS